MGDWPTSVPPRRVAPRVGVALHEDRFIAPVVDAFEGAGCVVRRDVWTGHRMHRIHLSRDVARWSDVVFAEWCLGNAVWHATHRRDGARLIVRLHRFELETAFPTELDFAAVDAMVFVSAHVREEALSRFGWPAERCLVIHNPVDTAAFDRTKTPDAPHTLGMLTWNRSLKRLDLALDLLEELREQDPRYRLRLKGERPEEVEHIWKYEEERAYFAAQYERVATSPLLQDAVGFDPQGPDVADWFSGVGYVLSMSDVESFHLALAEGMASRAVPIIRAREGVEELFGAEWIVPDGGGAEEMVHRCCGPDAWREAGERARAEIVRRYDRSVILPEWTRLLSADAARLTA